MAKKARAKTRKYEDILYEVKDQIAWITINRPRVMNAFREQSLDEMIDAVKGTREDPSIAAIVFKGAGTEAFSAGGDFYAMKRLNWTNGAMWNDRMQGLAMAIRGVPIPVIAMVNGWCMGGGHELALWCDLVIASEKSMLGQTGAKVGACPTVGATQYLPRIIGERLEPLPEQRLEHAERSGQSEVGGVTDARARRRRLEGDLVGRADPGTDPLEHHAALRFPGRDGVGHRHGPSVEDDVEVVARTDRDGAGRGLPRARDAGVPLLRVREVGEERPRVVERLRHLDGSTQDGHAPSLGDGREPSRAALSRRPRGSRRTRDRCSRPTTRSGSGPR